MARIAIIGGGAVGCFYAAQCVLAGHDVRLLLRRDADRVSREGLRLRQTPTDQVAGTARVDLVLPPTSLRVCRAPGELVRGGPPEWTLVALKATALTQSQPLLAPIAECGSDVVVLCNGLDVERDLAGMVSARRLFGMLCFVCVNREDDGLIHHLAHGRVAVGHLEDDATQSQRLHDLMSGAGIRCDRVDSLREARWRKLAWNIPFNGLGVVGAQGGADTAMVLGDAGLRARAGRLMLETIAVANADLASGDRRGCIDPITFVPELFSRTAGMGRYRTSTQLDWLARRPIEWEALFQRPLRRAYELSVPVPELTSLVHQLERAVTA